MARRLLFAALLIAAACSKKENGDKPADQPGDPGVKPTPQQPAEKPANPPPAKIKQATNVDDLGMLPVDSESVFGVNLAAIQQSPLWNEFIAPRVMSDSVKSTLDDFKTKCNVDPLTVVKSASIGLKDSTKEAVLVVHGPDKAKVMACADKMKAEQDPKVTVSTDGDVTMVKATNGDVTVAFQFIDDDSAVIVVGAKANAAGVKAAMAKTGGLASSAAFVDMYNRIDTEKSLWMLLNGKNKAFQALAMAGIKPTHAFGALDVSEGIDLDLRLRLASPDQATQSATMMKTQLGTATTMLKIDKLEASADGSDLKIQMVVAKSNIGSMLSQLKALQSMGGGGGMGGP